MNHYPSRVPQIRTISTFAAVACSERQGNFHMTRSRAYEIEPLISLSHFLIGPWFALAFGNPPEVSGLSEVSERERSGWWW